MTQNPVLDTVIEFLQPLLAEDMFLVDIRIKPTNNIKLFLDADNGLPIDKCTKINKALYRAIEEAGLYPEGDFSLEVSSPGIDEPLKLFRQYVKNKGRDIQVLLNDETTVTGKLIDVNEEFITVEFTEGKNKKAVVKKQEISFSTIKQAKIQIKF